MARKTFTTLFVGCILWGNSAAADSLQIIDGLVYDKSRNLYWAKDASLGGLMTWNEVLVWIKTLNKESYGGYSDWRLPSTLDGYSENPLWDYKNGGNLAKYNVTVSELGHLFYECLGLQGLYAKDGTKNSEYGLLGNTETPFNDLQA